MSTHVLGGVVHSHPALAVISDISGGSGAPLQLMGRVTCQKASHVMNPFQICSDCKATPQSFIQTSILGRSKVQNAMKQRTRPRLGCWVDQCWSSLNTKGQRHMKLFLGRHRCFDLKWTWTRLSSLWSFSGWFALDSDAQKSLCLHH